MACRLLIASLLALAACDGGRLVDAQARVQVPEQAGFGSIWVGGEARAVVFIESLGQAPIEVTRVAIDDVNVSLSTTGGALAGGARMRVELIWRPSVPGPLAARLVVETDVEDARLLSVQVSGEAKALPACDDGNPCTDDVFDRTLGRCTFAPHERACDDGNACTSGDVCLAGVCRGRAVSCDDDNVCTRDLCDAATGCFHLPDERVCDDGDPCTSDVCDPDDGCSYPDAPNGTACGDFSCDTANVCIMGTCRPIDVSGSSDGVPCSDGDACTRDDECLGGVCVPGEPIRSEPEITARFETFGGSGSLVGSDGSRFVFADFDALRVAVLGVDGALSHVGTLPYHSTVPPVVVGPARFLVANGDELALLDVSDPALPRLIWQERLFVPNAASTGVHRLAAGHQGVAAVLGEGLFTSEVFGATVVWVPLDGPDLRPLSPVVMASLPSVLDLDASGLVLAWSDPSRVWLARLPSSRPDGAPVLEQVEVAARRLSLDGLRLAVLDGPRVKVIDIATPATPPPAPCTGSSCETVDVDCLGGPAGEFASCETAPCEEGLSCGLLLVEGCPQCDCAATCCQPVPRKVCMRPGPTGQSLLELLTYPHTAKDVVLSGRVLAWATSEGVIGVGLDDAASMASSARVLDPMQAQRLERAPAMLLATDRLALPLSIREAVALEPPTPSAPFAVRLTGPRHGDVWAITDGFGTRVSLAGGTTVGQLDVAQPGLTAWSLLPTASSPERPRLLKGVSRWANLHDRLEVRPSENECASFETVTGLGTLDSLELCGHFGGPTDIAGTTLWAHSPEERPPGADVDLVWSARAWHLLPHSSEPVVDKAEVAPRPGSATAMRGADRGSFGVFIERLAEHLRVSILRAGQPASAVVGTVEVPWTEGGGVSRTRAASDGNLVLIGDATSASLYDAGDPAVVPRATLTLPTDFPVQVQWMAGGRAWLGWGNGEGFRLSQVYFDATGELIDEGAVELPVPASRVFDTGQVGVVNAGREILVVAPACR